MTGTKTWSKMMYVLTIFALRSTCTAQHHQLLNLLGDDYLMMPLDEDGLLLALAAPTIYRGASS